MQPDTAELIGDVARPRLVFTSTLWTELLEELAARGLGLKESGAFLLGDGNGVRRVTSVAYYDDLDPDCLTGGISFASAAYGRLWDVCAARNAKVVADVHTHPGRWVAQSATDRDHPMLAVAGHIALIVPCLAQGTIEPVDVGVHDYLGEGEWRSSFDDDAANRIVLEGSRTRRRMLHFFTKWRLPWRR